MFCGLCTTVCPTECLTMTSEYDFSTFDITNHNFEFGNLTPEQAQEKRELYERFVIEKEAMKLIITEPKTGNSEVIEIKPKPAFKPSFKPKVADNQEIVEKAEEVVPEIPKPKPTFKPSFKPKVVDNQEITEETEEVVPEIPKPKSAFKPSFKTKLVESQEVVEKIEEEIPEVSKPKPAFKPSFKPKAVENKEIIEDKIGEEPIIETPKPKPVFKPTFKHKPKVEENDNSTIQ